MEDILERFKALRLEEKIIIVAAVVLFIDGFLPWYNVDYVVGSISRNGWQSPGAIWSILAVLIGVAMAGVVVLKGFTDVALPENVGGVTWPRILFGAGVAALVCVLIKLLNESSFLGFGFYLGIISAGALAFAGFLSFRSETEGAG